MKNNDVDFVRKYGPGIIGDQKTVDKATDTEVAYLIGLQDQIAHASNFLRNLEIRKDNIIKEIERR